MHGACQCRGIVNEGFEGVALALGGVAVTYEIPDEAVWDLARAIDVTCQRVRARLSHTEATIGLDDLPVSGCSHPAVVHLLRQLRSDASERGGHHGSE